MINTSQMVHNLCKKPSMIGKLGEDDFDLDERTVQIKQEVKENNKWFVKDTSRKEQFYVPKDPMKNEEYIDKVLQMVIKQYQAMSREDKADPEIPTKCIHGHDLIKKMTDLG